MTSDSPAAAAAPPSAPPPSARAVATVNPIRNLVQSINLAPNPEKPVLSLSVGDPTVFGNLRVPEAVSAALAKAVVDGDANGYAMSNGAVAGRRAVVGYMERMCGAGAGRIGEEDVVLTAGASGAIELAISSIADAGDNILVPMPGFPLFETLAGNLGVEVRHYPLDPDSNWEVRLDEIEPLVDARTKLFVLNNPSNPCGSVYSSAHLASLLAVLSRLNLSLLSDEIYAGMAFSASAPFTSVLALISAPSSPAPPLTMVIGGISKRFVVPGWRLGWLVLAPHPSLAPAATAPFRAGVRSLTTRMILPAHPVTAVLPEMLAAERDGDAEELVAELARLAGIVAARVAGIEEFEAGAPQGSMYVMVRVDLGALGMGSDAEFVGRLYEEESVMLLPGACFKAEGFVRIVFSAPERVLEEAFDRIEAFCARHRTRKE